ncbi:MAG: hypothetical protein JNL87_03025 [Burkholderiaceae bacterium]|nr:hypothetical protein [Burkholderiaceae bacterium]
MSTAALPVPGLPTRYPGAQPFADSDLSRKLFSGREQESNALTHQILANRLVVLFARSGLGKTSLLNAGVIEALRDRGYLPLAVRLNDVENGAIASLYSCIRTACLARSIEYVVGDDRDLWHFFKTAEFWQDDVLLEPVLILDQFEELFTLQSEAHRSAFIDQLSALVRGVRPDHGDAQSSTVLSDAPPRVKVVISMREDFLAHVEELSNRIPEILDNRFRLLPLSRAAAAKAIERPSTVVDEALATAPFRIGEDAKALILDFLERRSGRRSASAAQIEPFQLQLICQYLEELSTRLPGNWQDRPMSADDIGGEARLRRIITDFYRRQLATVPLMQRLRVRSLCSESLISPSGRRLRVEESEIKRLTGVRAGTLQMLVERRLLRVEPSETGLYYELSHDSLVAPVLESRRAWFLLRSVLLALFVVIVVGVFALFMVYTGGFIMLGDLSAGDHLIVWPIAALIGWFGLTWIRRMFREVVALWRRSRI